MTNTVRKWLSLERMIFLKNLLTLVGDSGILGIKILALHQAEC